MSQNAADRKQEILNRLTPEEREVALSILGEYSDTGESKTYQDIVYSDYDEVPVDIETFLTDDRYLGRAWEDAFGKLKMYPFWLNKLREIFPNNTDTSYDTLLESGARGIGKSEVACGAVGAYLMYRIMCLRKPLEYYHLKPTEKIIFAFMNITKEASKKIAIDKFQKTVQMSPWFMSRGKMTQFENNPFWIPPDPIQIVIGSQSSDIIGLPVMFAFFDEISFIRNQDIEVQKKKAMDMIDTAIGGMKTRFIHKGKNPTLLVVASSKRSEQSFMETYIKSLREIKGDKTCVVDEPVWKVKPEGTYSDKIFYIGLGNKHLESTVVPDGADIEQYKKRGYELIEVPIDFKEDAMKDLNRTLCDFAGISSFSSNKFISAEMVNDCVSADVFNPMPDVIRVGNGSDDKSEYCDFFQMDKVDKKYMGKPLFIHLDMSLSGDKTGIAGVWIIGKKPTSDGNPGKDLWFQPAFSFSVEAPYGRQVSFAKNRNFIRWLKDKGFRIKKITSDTFQSAQLQQELKSEGFDCSILSVDRVEQIPGEHTGICRPYEYLKSTIYEKRIRLYAFPDANRTYLLYDELVQLEKNNGNGRVDHPNNGKTGSKDQSDAICGATYTASQFADDYAYDYGEDFEQMLSLNEKYTDVKQMTVRMEDELRNMGPAIDDRDQDADDDYSEDGEFYNPYDNIIIF